MSYNIAWLIPERVILVQVHQDSTMSEWGAIQNEIIALTETGTAPVHAIIDVAFNHGVMNLREVSNVSGLKPFNDPRMGWYVILQNSIIIRFFASLVIQLFSPKGHFVMVSTMEEGVKVLKHHDSTLENENFLLPIQPTDEIENP